MWQINQEIWSVTDLKGILDVGINYSFCTTAFEKDNTNKIFRMRALVAKNNKKIALESAPLFTEN